MATLHVIPDERGGWRLFDSGCHAAVSEHNSATEAERSAWQRLPDAGQIVVHDRYGRTRPAVRFGARREVAVPAILDGPRGEPVRLHLDCPRCGLTIRPRASWLTVEHCPRCLARSRLPVRLVSSTPAGPRDRELGGAAGG